MPTSITAAKNDFYIKDPKNYHQVQWHNPDPKGVLSSGKLHPEFARRLSLLIDEAHKQGLDIMLFEGSRSFERQNQLFLQSQGKPDQKATTVTGGKSWHNYGLAVDIVFYDKKGNPSWAKEHNWTKLGKIGKELGLKWGGDWGWDKVHFEYHPDLNMGKARQLYKKGGTAEVWKTIPYSLISI